MHLPFAYAIPDVIVCACRCLRMELISVQKLRVSAATRMPRCNTCLFSNVQRGKSEFVGVTWLQGRLMLIQQLYHYCFDAITTITITVSSILIIVVVVVIILANVSTLPQVGSLTLTKPNLSQTLQPQS